MLTVADWTRRNPASTAATIGLMLSSAAAPSTWIEIRGIEPVVSWPTRLPSRSASAMYGFSLGASSAERLGMLSALVTPPLTRKSAICSATCSATLTCASLVDAPRCGVQMKFGVPNSGLSLAGSVWNTSSAAPATWPLSSAAFSAASSIRPPRAQLMIRTPFLVLARFSAERILRVWSVSGVCSVMKSARASSSSSSTFSIPSSTARSGERNGSKATTFILRPSARLATIEPILPAPIRPSVLAVSSTPMKSFLGHLPAWVWALASGIWRASANISAIACSAVVIELPNGVFMTTTPCAEAAGISTLSTPIPARPITLRFFAAARTTGVTLVELRIARPS